MSDEIVLEIMDLSGKQLEIWPGKRPRHVNGEPMSYENMVKGVINNNPNRKAIEEGVIVYIKDSRGNVLYKHKEDPKYVLSI